MLPLITLLPALWLASTPSTVPQASPPQQPAPQCLSSQGRTVCGFKCTSSGTDVQCAQTPYGVCQVLAGRVHCWDPPLAVIHHPPARSAKPECKESRGQVACGYNCRVFNGTVTCMRTPYGVCTTTSTRMVCWDPPESVIHQYGAETPAPRCLTSFDAVGCGYDCKAANTRVQCTSTPRGVCRLENNQLTCFDPPALMHCDHSAAPAPTY